MSSLKPNSDYSVLVIDDTKTDRELFKFILKREGYNVEVAEDGEQALKFLEKKEFDLVLCDYFMPKIDGYEFLKQVKLQPKYISLIVIIVTSDEAPDTRLKLLRAGANDFIHKGASPDEIMARVHAHLNAADVSATKAVLRSAGNLAHEINQPLSALIVALDLLKEKVQKELPAEKNNSFLPILKTINTQADRIQDLTENIRKIGMDPTKHYRIEKMLL